MTQQDETRQRAATDQADPSLPSPYLDASEGLPQAYLAPPQPGQAKYGTGAQAWSGPQRGPRSRRDASIAAPWERLVAATVDWIIIFAVSVLLFWLPLVRIGREVQGIMVTLQGRSSPAAQAVLLRILSDSSNQHVLKFWAVSVFGIALVYYWAQYAAWGATLGKRAVGIRVVQFEDRARMGVKTAGIRAIAFLAGPCILWLVISPINLVGGLMWVADVRLALVDPDGRCLHDKVAGTLVLKKRWLDQQAEAADR